MAAWTERWRRRLGSAQLGATLVVEAHGRVAGFVSAGSARDEDTPRAAEIYGLYVAPLHWGTGAGRALMAGALEHLREQAFVEAILWVLRDNPRARRFYEREGWVADGAGRPISVLGTEVEDVRYRRSF